MASREEALAELHKRGLLKPEQKAAVEELANRGKIKLDGFDFDTRSYVESVESLFDTAESGEPLTTRQQAMQELAKETGPIEAGLVSAGQQFYNVGRLVGAVDPADEIEKEAMEALREERPISTAIGDAAPFAATAPLVGSASLPVRAVGSGLVGGTEGAAIQEGLGEDVIEGAAIGGGIGFGAEILFPVIGRLGRKIYQRVTGRAPRGAMLDATGRPTQELSEALDAADMSFDDLTQDATEFIGKQKPGAAPEQVARAARAADEGVPLSRGEVTQGFKQQATEQRLLESAEDAAAEPFRQFKLRQSEAINKNLRSAFDFELIPEETGTLIQDALTGRKKLLRTQKNELYKEAAEAAKEVGGLPLFVDNIADSLPDADTMEDLAITAGPSMESLNKILTKYGVIEPTEKMIKDGFEPTQLTIQNFDRFRKTLGNIAAGDQTGAASVAIGPIKDALEREADELARVLKSQGVSRDVIRPLRMARAKVRRMKREFAPNDIIGKLINPKKKGGDAMVTEASRVYNKLIGRSSPPEEMRRVVQSLSRGGDKGKEALAAMQTTTVMDLIDAGFGTKSRKIDGITIFNPIAFRNRLDAIGDSKLRAIFGNEGAVYNKLKNIEKIAADLTPPSGATPKGSASFMGDMFNRLGLISLTGKIPGGAVIADVLTKPITSAKTRISAGKAQKAIPEVTAFRDVIDKNFPGIASALSVAATVEGEPNE